MSVAMGSDELDTAHQDQLVSWCTHFDEKYGYLGVERLASRYRDGQHCRCVSKACGSFNLCIKVVFDDDTAWAVRFPLPGQVMQPEEKLRREAAVLRFIEYNTRIPIPTLVAFGSGTENEDPEVGPFIITTWVEGVSLQSLLEKLPRPDWGPVLRDDIDDEIFYKIYSQIADILLELASKDFERIGSLTMSEENNQPSWSIVTRPLTQKMNDIESNNYVVVDDHTSPPFDNVTNYMEHLLQQSTSQLYDQRNSVLDSEEARREFILHRRMQELLPYFISEYDSGPFKLYCDDFHPRNILVDKDTYQITAVIDWEWTYAAPQSFSYTIPSWLILNDPAVWSETSKNRFKKQMTLSTQALEDAEKQREQNWPIERQNKGRMSTAMRQSFDDGTFWFEQILRSVYTCSDEFYWPYLKPFLEERRLLSIGLPDEEEIQQFVTRKMKDLEAYNKELDEKKNKQHARSELDWTNQSTDHADGDTAVVEPEDIQHEEAETHLTSQPRDQAYTSICDCADSEATFQDPPHTSAIADTRCIEQAGTSADDHVDGIAADSAG